MACRPGVKTGEKCQCFEVLGFDVLLDENMKPWLLEVTKINPFTTGCLMVCVACLKVNRSPSFGIDSQLDLDIKTGVIYDAIRLVGIK